MATSKACRPGNQAEEVSGRLHLKQVRGLEREVCWGKGKGCVCVCRGVGNGCGDEGLGGIGIDLIDL